MHSSWAAHLSVSKFPKKIKRNSACSGGQQVRVVVRALNPLQFAEGVSPTPRLIRLRAQAVRNLARRYQKGGLEAAIDERQSPGAAAVLDASQKQRIIAVVCSEVRPLDGATGRQEPSSASWRSAWEEKTSAFFFWTTTSSRGGEKMWWVAELDDEYIGKMEDALEMYEKPYDPAEPVVYFDEKPVTLRADVRAPRPAKPGREARRDNENERRGECLLRRGTEGWLAF